MKVILQDPFLDPNEILTSGMFPHLTELTRELPELLASTKERDEIASREDPKIEPLAPVEWMNQLAEVTRAYQAAHQLVQSQAELLGQTVASFGRL